MSINYNGASATDGLVFAYDLGNVRSYKGEPTTNLLDGATYQDIRNWSGYRQPEDITVLSETYKGSPVYRLANAAGVDPGTYTDKYLMANFPELTSLTVGDTYSFSFDFRVIQKSTVQNNGGASNGAWVWYLTTANQIAFSDYDEGVWHRANIQATVNSTYDFAIPRIDFDNSIVDVCNFQFEKKPHATQFVNGTRTATEGLLDIIGGAPIDLTNVSFDSNAQMVFDNTDDFIEFPPGVMPNFSTNDFAIEVVFKMDYNTSYNHFYTVGDQQHFGLKQNRNNSDYRIYVYRTSTLSTYSNIAIDATPGQTHHLVCQRNGDNIEMYLNGEYKGSKSGWGNIDIEGDTLPTKIGNGWGSEFSKGSQYITKVYNRALTAEEVAQNFNSLKNRFNL